MNAFKREIIEQARDAVKNKSLARKIINSSTFNIFRKGSQKSTVAEGGIIAATKGSTYAIGKAIETLVTDSKSNVLLAVPVVGQVFSLGFNYLFDKYKKSLYQERFEKAKNGGNVFEEIKYLIKLTEMGKIASDFKKVEIAHDNLEKIYKDYKSDTHLTCDAYYKLACCVAQVERRVNILEEDGERLRFLGNLLSSYSNENKLYMTKALDQLQKGVSIYADSYINNYYTLINSTQEKIKKTEEVKDKHKKCEYWCICKTEKDIFPQNFIWMGLAKETSAKNNNLTSLSIRNTEGDDETD